MEKGIQKYTRANFTATAKQRNGVKKIWAEMEKLHDMKNSWRRKWNKKNRVKN